MGGALEEATVPAPESVLHPVQGDRDVPALVAPGEEGVTESHHESFLLVGSVEEVELRSLAVAQLAGRADRDFLQIAGIRHEETVAAATEGPQAIRKEPRPPTIGLVIGLVIGLASATRAAMMAA